MPYLESGDSLSTLFNHLHHLAIHPFHLLHSQCLFICIRRRRDRDRRLARCRHWRFVQLFWGWREFLDGWEDGRAGDGALVGDIAIVVVIDCGKMVRGLSGW
jgi:hypothetical protein